MNRVVRTLIALSAVAVCAPSVSAQGSDDCTIPTTISGAGAFSFDCSNATTGVEGQVSSACNAHGSTGIAGDVWFTWLAYTSDVFTISTCGSAGFDTKIAVYAGFGCPSAGAIACNDDACGAESSLDFGAISGSTYTIQIGSSPGMPGGAGTFIIADHGGGCAGPSNGPDVIVGDMINILNVPAVSGLDAFALGTTSCNIGNVPVQWQAGNNQHPVIGSTLYRFRIQDGSGRFEQIGMSWLKHGFAALTDSFCCTCIDPGTISLLGVGCSDPYDANINAQQAGLSPRWQVNAHTGAFPFPAANPPWLGITARRCEVALSDLDVTAGTTHFFAESTYVTADDAAAGNNDNNASYTEVSVSGSPVDYVFTLAGAIQPTMPAIEAWPTLETGVTLVTTRVPGDGLFFVGSHATALGGGTWHYEYAVYNLNCDRACSTFSVAVPPAASVTNVGFHGATYRNGDGPGNVNFSATDWSTTIAGGVLTWATETFAQNRSANAIRWSTTYNFRFDANVAPTSGSVALGLWKSGIPASVSALADVPGVGPATFSFCFGDGSGTACPCGNSSAAGAQSGCLNSFGAGGALTASGNASISADNFVLTGARMPNSSALYFQGTTLVAGGAGTTFGDGLRCAGGSLARLGTEVNVGGVSQYPWIGDTPISVRGGNTVGSVRTYQCWYRNSASFCQPETFNLTNGIETTWGP